MVMSSAALFGVPLSSTTVMLVSVTSPQLVTTPLNEMVVVPNGTVAGHVLVTLMHGEVGTVVVQFFFGLEIGRPQRSIADATTVSVIGPQKLGPTVCVPEYGTLV